MVNFDIAVPLIGGPFCGESISAKGNRIPKSLPMYKDKKFYLYDLKIENGDETDFCAVFYEYTNRVEEFEKIKSNY